MKKRLYLQLFFVTSIIFVVIFVNWRYGKEVGKKKNTFTAPQTNGCLGEELRNLEEKEQSEEILFIKKVCAKDNQRLQKCSKNLYGRLTVDMNKPINVDELMKNESFPLIRKGGWFAPTSCAIQRHVAIIVPFRNRETHLPIFLRHMHPILQRQNLHYRIFVVDQVDENQFNRGKLFNVGFTEARKIFPYNCFVFHDVDLLSEDDRNTYDCSTSPQHMCASLDKFGYNLLYHELFGGVEMFTKDHFEMINGFSNSFWGWGAEDDNLYRRMLWQGLSLWRPPMEYSRYKMITHKDKEATASKNRYKLRDESLKHFATDGLTNLQYEVKSITNEPFYTSIKVHLRKNRDKLFGVMEFPT